MSIVENKMKQRLARGEPALGCSMMFASPQVVEMLGYAGFDWVLLDCEHGSLSLGDLELMCMAADAAGITPIARPRTNSAADIQSVLDRGAHGVQVPHINCADDARRAVAAVKFGKAGRGLAAGTRPDRWGLGAKMPDFVAKANAGNEDDGWLMGYVIDTRNETTDLVILDAANFEGAPQAAITIPHRIPPGFHGNWMPAV